MNNNDETEIGDEYLELAARLPTEMSPDRDLWPGIERAIAQPARPARTVWNSAWAQAAAVVLLVAGSSGITYVAVKGDTHYRGPEVITPDQTFASVLFEPPTGAFGQRYTLGDEYLAARDGLADGIEKKLDLLEPTTRDDVVNNLNTIRGAINDINAALVKEPDSVLLRQLLLTAYHEEMSLMTKIDGIANAAMRRHDI